MEYLKAQTVRSAKIQAKRSTAKGGTVYGYVNEMGISIAVYFCHIQPLDHWGRRRCISSRIEVNHSYEVPHFFTFSED